MKIRLKAGYFLILIAVICSVLITGCVTHSERHTAASVVDFLYPDVKDPVVTPGIPVLKLPLRVGIAFVPGAAYGSGLTEQKKMDLMKQVANRFKSYPFIKDIELIPTAYLRNKGGFANLEQIRTMYGVDVVALVSYDQVQFTDQGLLSLTYWTIVGAYVVPGEMNDTQTMLDTVVVDISSKQMLFRAPGVDHVKGRSTPVNLSEQLRIDSDASFGKAANQMIENLDQQLAAFKDKVKEHPDDYKVVRTAEYQARTGGGSLDIVWIVLVAVMGIAFVLSNRCSVLK